MHHTMSLMNANEVHSKQAARFDELLTVHASM